MVRTIKKDFIAVSVSNYDQNREDAVGDFIRQAGMKFSGAGGSHWFVTADGKLLGTNVTQALRTWYTIPSSASRAGAIKVPAMDVIDSRHAAAVPPPGALIVKVYYRVFMRKADGNLRYVTDQDLWYDESGTKTRHGEPLVRQAVPDHMWLTRAESQSLIPSSARVGETYPLPADIAVRLCRWHLNPRLLFGEDNPLRPKDVRSVELTLTIEAMSSDSIRLRLNGLARLGKEAPPVANTQHASMKQWGYEPRLFGILEFDRKRQLFTRFDIVALGDQFGRLGILGSPARPGCQPLGVAFELAQADVPAERIPPGRTVPARKYFAVAK